MFRSKIYIYNDIVVPISVPSKKVSNIRKTKKMKKKEVTKKGN